MDAWKQKQIAEMEAKGWTHRGPTYYGGPSWWSRKVGTFELPADYKLTQYGEYAREHDEMEIPAGTYDIEVRLCNNRKYLAIVFPQAKIVYSALRPETVGKIVETTHNPYLNERRSSAYGPGKYTVVVAVVVVVGIVVAVVVVVGIGVAVAVGVVTHTE
jgi:hypothetical protein